MRGETKTINIVNVPPIDVGTDLMHVQAKTKGIAGQYTRWEKIETEQELRAAELELSNVTALEKDITAARLARTRPLEETKRFISSLFIPYTDEIAKYKLHIKSGIKRYLDELRAKQRKEQEERERKAKEANEKKKAAMLRKAEKAEKKGEVEKAEQLRDDADVLAPEISPAPIVSTPKVSTRIVWRAKVINRAMVPDEYKIIDQSKLEGIARVFKGEKKVPGVEFYTEEQVIARRR